MLSQANLRPRQIRVHRANHWVFSGALARAGPQIPGPFGAVGYRWERRGRNLIQARMPMPTSSTHGENRMWTAALRTIRATMAMATRAMMASMVIGLL